MSTNEHRLGERVEFTEPTSLTDAEERRRFIAEDISNIAQQLSSRKQSRYVKFVERHPNGTKGPWEVSPEERAENVAYMTWRTRALSALRAREKVLRQLNDWLKNKRREAYAAGDSTLPEDDTFQLMLDAYQVFAKLKEDDVEFDPDELEVVERLKKAVNG